MDYSLKPAIFTGFKMHGLSLRSDSARYLRDVLVQVDESLREECLENIIDVVQRQPLKSAMVDLETCTIAVQEVNTSHDSSDQILTVIDAFSIPHFTYVTDRKKFIPARLLSSPRTSLFGSADDRSEVFRERYTILHQRTCRHDLFTPHILGSVPEKHNKKFRLQPIEYLLGTTSKLGDIIILGMLAQLKEGKWYLEDPTGVVLLDLTEASYHSGLYCENCFVLAEGWYEDDVFHVNALGFPPPESANVTLSTFGNINFFGGSSETAVKLSGKLKHIEDANVNAMFVFISDVWLDNVTVLARLNVLFRGYSEMPPTCFVFFGNFASDPKATGKVKTMRENFMKLAQLILEYPRLLKESKFIFIPGPTDPASPNILPRPPLPKTVTSEFCERIHSAVFATNPCRIQYCTKEIIAFREDIVTKMCRNCIQFPADGDIPQHFAKTIVSQAYLCPLPMHVCPVYWNYSFALQVYPLPDLVVCANRFDPFSVEINACTILNPGSFARTDFAFKTYRPATKEIEDCQVTVNE